MEDNLSVAWVVRDLHSIEIKMTLKDEITMI